MGKSGENQNIIETVCHRDCPDSCFVDVVVEDGKILATKGSTRNPVTQGFLCPRGYGDPKRVYSRDRILFPYIKDQGKFRKTSWPNALEIVSKKLLSILDTSGRQSILLYDYPGNQGCLSWQFSQRLWRALGVTMTDGALCSSSGHTGIGLHYGLTYGVELEDVLSSGAVIYWGNNARVSSPHLWALSTSARKQNETILIAIDPRRSETAQGSDLWIKLRPGSDVALFYGIARYIIEQKLVPREFIDQWTFGFDLFKQEVEKWTVERVEKATKLSWRKVQNLCGILTQKKPVCFMIGLGLNKSRFGAESTRAVSLLPALLGQHRGFHYSNFNGRFIDWEYLNGTKMSKAVSQIVEQVSVGARLLSGEFKFVFVKGSNPALTLPDQTSVRAGLSREDTFLVVHDTHWTETAKLSDVVLPAATYLEKSDVNFCDHHVYARISTKTIEPLGESKSEIWVMQKLSEKIGCQEGWVNEDSMGALEIALKESFENGNFQDIVGGAVLRLKQRQVSEYQTPSKKIELCSSKALELDANPFPVQMPLDEATGSFTLLNSSLPNWTHSQFRDVYGPIPAVIWINPFDAKRLSIHNGDDVRVFNDQAELVLKAIVTSNVTRGVLWSPRPLTGNNGIPLNSLASGIPQFIGKGPQFNSIKVKIKPNK